MNKTLRNIITKRGIFPKLVREIYIQPVISIKNHKKYLNLKVKIFPRNVDNPFFIQEWLITSETMNIIKNLKTIRSTKCVMIDYWKCDKTFEKIVIDQLKEKEIFTNLYYIQFFRMETLLPLAKKIFSHFKPKSIENLNLFFGYDSINQNDFEIFWKNITWKDSFKSCQYFDFSLLGPPTWDIAKQINAKHHEFNGFYLNDFEERLHEIMIKGIPNNGSVQLRDYVFEEFSGTIENVFQRLLNIIQKFDNLFIINEKDLNDFEMKLFKKYRFSSSMRHIAETWLSKKHFSIESRDIWLYEEDTEKRKVKYFLQNQNRNEILIYVCVDQKKGLIESLLDLQVLWLPRQLKIEHSMITTYNSN